MYNNDVKALTEFLASYEKFDKAISDFSVPVFASNLDLNKANDLESKAGDALIKLNTKAAARLSSLTKNDAALMSKMLEIADFSGKELDNLRAYKRAIQSKNADLDGLAKEYGELTSKRKTAYARFQGLAPLGTFDELGHYTKD
jgi:tRNA A37 N6-isopentenylltransferase MiaA